MNTPYPKMISISVGSVCGYRCIFCNNPHDGTKAQSFENITKILENFKNAEIVDISGFGDLLLHPEFEQIVKLMTENNVAFSFITTAENLTPDKQEFLRKSSLRRINISLNSLNPETKKLLSGDVGDFDKVMRHFKEFVKKPRNYSVSISMVVCQHTFKETPDFVRFGIEHDVDAICLHQPLKGIVYPDNFDLTYSGEEWKYFDEAHRIATENNLSLGGFSKKETTGEVVIPPITQCRAPWNEVVIAPQGAIIPCFSSGYIVGNINTHSFAEIWDGEKITELRNAILEGKNNVGNCNLCVKFKGVNFDGK